MGLIKAGMGAIGGVLADQWKEYFYCDSMTPDVLMCKGQKRISSQGRSSNTSAEDNIISNGSVIAVNVGQCMMIVEQGKVVDLCAEPGEYTYDKSTEPSVFTGDLKESVIQVFQRMGKRFTFGGDTGKDQRVYYFNTKEIIGNKYGTPAEIPFKVIEENTGRGLLVRIRCFGEYSYKIVDPILFYSTIAGNAPDQYLRSQWDSQLKSELLTALQPAFGKISAQRIDYTELPMRTMELADALNDVLSSKWRDLRGIEIVSFGVNSVKANEEDEAKLQKVQMGAMMSNPDMRMGRLLTEFVTHPLMKAAVWAPWARSSAWVWQTWPAEWPWVTPTARPVSIRPSTDNRNSRIRSSSPRSRRQLPQRQQAGPVPADMPATPVSSAPTADSRNRNPNRRAAGIVPAAPKETPASSALTAANRSRKPRLAGPAAAAA